MLHSTWLACWTLVATKEGMVVDPWKGAEPQVAKMSWAESWVAMLEGKFVRLPDWESGDYLHMQCGSLKLYANGHYGRVASTTTRNMMRNDWVITTPKTRPSLWLARGSNGEIAVGQSTDEAAQHLTGTELEPYEPGAPLSGEWRPSTSQLLGWNILETAIAPALQPQVALFLERDYEFHTAILSHSDFLELMSKRPGVRDPYASLPHLSTEASRLSVVHEAWPCPHIQGIPMVLIRTYLGEWVVMSYLDYWVAWPSLKCRRRVDRNPYASLPQSEWPIFHKSNGLTDLEVVSCVKRNGAVYLSLGSANATDALQCQVPLDEWDSNEFWALCYKVYKSPLMPKFWSTNHP
jgi:hypothetical protein